MRARSLIGLVIASAALALPAAGRAGTYCVGMVPGCSGAPAGDLQSALSSAELSGEPDLIRIGPGEFTTGAAGFTYVAASPVEIVGAGAGATVLTTSAAAPSVLRVQGPAGATRVADLSVSVAFTGPRSGLVVSGTAERVAVTGVHTMNRGVELLGGSALRASSVALPRGGDEGRSFAVLTLGTAGATIEDVRLDAGVGVSVDGGAATVSRAWVDAQYGISTFNGRVRVTSSLVRVSGGGVGLAATAGAGGTVELEADGVTVAGTASPGDVSSGAVVNLPGTAGPGRLALRNTALVDLTDAIERRSLGAAAADVEVSHSAVDLAAVTSIGPGSLALGPGNIASPPGLLSAAADHRPAAGSPLVDAGDPAPPGAEGLALDLDGRPRVLGGRRDIGAFELPPAPLPVAGGGGAPVAPVAPVAPTAGPAARRAAPCAGRRGTALRRCRIAVRLRADLRRCARARPAVRARCRAVAQRRAGLARCRLLPRRRVAACRVKVLARPLPSVRRPRAVRR